MTNKQLRALANKISKKYFNETVKGTVTFNRRMKTNSSSFQYYKNKFGEMTDWKISINPLVLSYFGKKGLINILKNQLIHDYQGQHKDPCSNGYGFKKMAKKIGAPIYLKKCHPDTSRYYVYQCTNCLHAFLQKNKLDTNVYACGEKLTNAFGKRHSCNGKLVCVGRVTGAQLRNDKHNALAEAHHRAKLFKNYKHRMFAKFE